jgi:hypothetical protein
VTTSRFFDREVSHCNFNDAGVFSFANFDEFYFYKLGILFLFVII